MALAPTRRCKERKMTVLGRLDSQLPRRYYLGVDVGYREDSVDHPQPADWLAVKYDPEQSALGD